MNKTLHAVTGAFGYSGKYITKRLLDRGHEVITLTNSINRTSPFNDHIKPYPFNFDNPEELTRSLQGVSVLYNTYWVRFNHKMFKHADAVQNTLILLQAAKAAKVERIVHRKAKLERALADSGISYAILRPTVLFGKEDILINNIAWALRRLPVFGVFGSGEYQLQPIYVDDLAALAVEQGAKQEAVIIEAIGPETFTYKKLVKLVGETIGETRPIISVPPSLGYFAGWIIGKFVGDVLITSEEIKGLMADLLYVDSPPAGKTRLTDWMREHADSLGRVYTSELARRVDRTSEYGSN
jgi:NADH dehydrogenase